MKPTVRAKDQKGMILFKMNQKRTTSSKSTKACAFLLELDIRRCLIVVEEIVGISVGAYWVDLSICIGMLTQSNDSSENP